MRNKPYIRPVDYKKSLTIYAFTIFLLTVLIASAPTSTTCQDHADSSDANKYYTVKGRVVNDKGKPIKDAGVGIAPAKYVVGSDGTTGLQRFAHTDAKGEFSVQEYRDESTIGLEYFLFISVDNTVTARKAVVPPFVWIREHDRSFEGKPIYLGAESDIDVGDVRVQFWYGQANLDFTEFKMAKKLNVIDWSNFYLQIRNKDGHLVYFSSLSRNDIDGKTEHLDKAKSELRISLPEGKWKVEAVWNEKVLGESSYFVIKHGYDELPVKIRPRRSGS